MKADLKDLDIANVKEYVIKYWKEAIQKHRTTFKSKKRITKRKIRLVKQAMESALEKLELNKIFPMCSVEQDKEDCTRLIITFYSEAG